VVPVAEAQICFAPPYTGLIVSGIDSTRLFALSDGDARSVERALPF
jgi:hypothetical protein